MITKIRWIETECGLPYRNLAVEKILMNRVAPGECILYLWQNRNTVVIGRNQDACEECQVERLQADGGYLARRYSGGGAVYHDDGNLNFSFLMLREDEDPARQTEVILRAVRALGIPAERTGRNDLETNGRKFSGHAWYKTLDRCCHHGTLMMNVDLERMNRYLTAAPAKLRSRSVQSVRSRVMNLKEIREDINRSKLTAELIRAFEEVYGLRAESLILPAEAETEIDREKEELASASWLFPPRMRHAVRTESRFSWGGIRLEMLVDGGMVLEAVCRSDAMDEELIREIGNVLHGCAWNEAALAERLNGLNCAGKMDPAERERRRRIIADVTGMFREKGNLHDSAESEPSSPQHGP